MGLLGWLKGKIGKGEAKAIVKGASVETLTLRKEAKAAIAAETKAELTTRTAIRKRKEFSESLRAYKLKREAERRIRKIPVYYKYLKKPTDKPYYQFGATFDLKNEKTGEIKKGVEGWSMTLETKDYEEGYDQAVKSAQLKAGDTNWGVIGVKNERWRVYK